MLTVSITTFVIGLIIGSFLNVVIYRLPEEISIIKPPSHCLECGTRLSPLDLVPVFSYLIYRGRCRYCGTKISIQYPLVELLNGFLYLFTYLKFGFSLEMVGYLILISLLIAISFIDLKYRIIPNKLSYFGIIIGLIFSIFSSHITFISSFLGIFIPAGLLLILALIYKKGMGIGDVKLVGMIGAFTGYKIVLSGIFLGSVIGLIFFTPLILSKRIDRKTKIPFGPFISTGSIIMIFYGETLLDWYLNLFI